MRAIIAVLAAVTFCSHAMAQTCPYNPPPLVQGGWASPLPISKKPMQACPRRVVASQPREYLGEVFFNSGTGVGYAPEVWHEIDITAMSGGAVPRNATSVFLSGIAIITNVTASNGSAPQYAIAYAGIYAAFRAPGDASITLDCNYAIQAFTAHANEGVRSGVAIRVPLVDGKVEMAWRGTNYVGVGQAPFYGLNLTVQDYCEPE